MLMWKTRLAFISILLVLPVVGFVVGAYIGDATCEPDEGFLGGSTASTMRSRSECSAPLWD